MSIERDVVSTGAPVSASELLKSKFGNLTAEEIVARNVRIVDRSRVNVHLDVPNLPDEYYGEWVHLHDVTEYEGKGFVVDNEFATALHNDGTGKAIVSDVTFMITTKENKAALDYMLSEDIRRRQDPHNRPENVGDLETALGKENVRVDKTRKKIGLRDINDVARQMEEEEAQRREESNNEE